MTPSQLEKYKKSFEKEFVNETSNWQRFSTYISSGGGATPEREKTIEIKLTKTPKGVLTLAEIEIAEYYKNHEAQAVKEAKIEVLREFHEFVKDKWPQYPDRDLILDKFIQTLEKEGK